MKRILLFNFIILIFLIFLCEITIRTFKLSQLMGIDSKILIVGKPIHELKPFSSGYVFSKKVFIDEDGNRIPENYQKSVYKKKILIIGDSVAFGNGVIEENTFVGLLRKKYNEFEFINTSVPGYDLFHFEGSFQKISNYENIEKIFYFLTLNDVLNSNSIVPWHKRNKKKLNKELGFIQKIINNEYLRNLNFYLRNKSYTFMFVKGILTDPSKRWYSNINLFYTENKIDHLNSYLKNLIELSKKKKANLHIVILPYEFQTRNCKMIETPLPQLKIRKQLDFLQINFSDFFYDFCKVKNPKKLFYKFDPMHLSIKGHKKVFELIDYEANF